MEFLLELPSTCCGNRVAIGPSTDGITFDRLARRAATAAAAFGGFGAKHVAYVGRNGPEFSVAVLAALTAGIPIVPLNYRLPPADLAALIDRLDTPLVLADADVLERLPVRGHHLCTIADWWSVTNPDGPAERTEAVARADDPAVMLFTSGTTSTPKCVVLRQDHLASYVLRAVDPVSAGADECALVSLPPYHIAGVMAVLTNTCAARRVVHLSTFDPQAWLDTVRDQGVTTAMVVPTMLARLVDCLNGTDAGVPTLRTLSYGGARLPASVLERALTSFPTTGLVNAYGLTETSSTIAALGPEDHRTAFASEDPDVRARLTSVGRPLPGVEVAVRSAAGASVPAGDVGDLWVRGRQVSGEYTGSGSTLDADGWFRTRDLARIDAEGFLFIEGRADDTIIRGGENVAPAEVEDALLHHPDIREAAVVGVPDEEWGERIAAAVVLVPEADTSVAAITAWAQQRLRSSRTPDQIVFWPSLPYNAVGKLLRRQVAQALTAGGTAADKDPTRSAT